MAAQLWELRDRAVEAPHFGRADLVRLDTRIEGHIRRLRAAGEAGLGDAAGGLSGGETPGALFVAAVLALETGSMRAVAPLIDEAEDSPGPGRGLNGAIGWVPLERLRPLLRPWFNAPRAFPRHLGLVACSAHRADPGRRLAGFLDDPSPLVRARAARLAGEIGRHDLAPGLLRLQEDDDEEVAAWSAWALGLFHEPSAVPELERLAEAGWRPALRLVPGAMGAEAARSWLRQLNPDAFRARLVVECLGILGDPQTVPWLLGRMTDPALARPAGESLSLMTGLDLARDDLAGDPPDDDAADPADPAPAGDPDAHLPWPDAELCAAWWERHSRRFAPGTRHLLGRPLDADACARAWNTGFQRQRRAAAYALALRRPASPLRNWRRRFAPS